MRIVFFGTPDFAASILDYLFRAGVEVVAVVTQPDRPKGRFLQMSPSPVKECALQFLSPREIFQPEKASDPQFLARLREVQADLFVVVAFGQIVPQQLLDIPPKGCINVHASLLPKYRGAAPIQRALMNGDAETGVSIQKMVKQLDAGDVIGTAKLEISVDMTFGELHDALCELSKSLLLLILQSYDTGDVHAEPQNHTLASYASKISTEEGEIHWERPAAAIHCQVRALSPRPGAWSWVYQGVKKVRVKILRTCQAASSLHGAPGQVLSSDGMVACGLSVLKILDVQPEGKRAMKALDWLRGCKELPRFCSK